MNQHPLRAMRAFVVTVIAATVLGGCSKQPREQTDANQPMKETPSPLAKSATPTPDIEPKTEPAPMPPATPPLAGRGEREGAPNPAAPQSDPRLRPPLVGTGRTVPRPPVSPHVQKVTARVAAEMQGLKANDPALPEKFAKLWKTAWPSSFNAPLPDGANANVAAGRVLPSAVADSQAQRESFIAKMQGGELGTIANNEELEAAYMMFALAVGDAQSGAGNLMRVIAERANQVPPTKGDLVLFNIASQALRDMQRTGPNATTFADLIPLAEGKNPMYRLLALQASYNAVTNPTRNLSSENPQAEVTLAPARTAFYQMYLNESDPAILSEAVRAMGTVPSADAKAALQRFRATQQQAGNAELVNAADEALRSCESLLATLKPER